VLQKTEHQGQQDIFAVFPVLWSFGIMVDTTPTWFNPMPTGKPLMSLVTRYASNSHRGRICRADRWAPDAGQMPQAVKVLASSGRLLHPHSRI
jgi:hypothetical protein